MNLPHTKERSETQLNLYETSESLDVHGKTDCLQMEKISTVATLPRCGRPVRTLRRMLSVVEKNPQVSAED